MNRPEPAAFDRRRPVGELIRLLVAEWLLGKAADILPYPERTEFARFLLTSWMRKR